MGIFVLAIVYVSIVIGIGIDGNGRSLAEVRCSEKANVRSRGIDIPQRDIIFRFALYPCTNTIETLSRTSMKGSICEY